MISRRDFLRFTGVVSAGALLNACQPFKNIAPQSGDEQIQLVYQDWRTDWFPPMAQEMLAKFHNDHPNLRVFYVPDAVDVEESLIKDMEAGTAPDVFAACCSYFPILAQEHYTLDLRPYVATLDQETLTDWDAAQVQALFTPDGRQYGLPKYHGALALFYNKDILDEFQVDYPDESWDHTDYLEAMKRLTHDRDGDGQTDLWGSMIDISWDRIQVHVNAWGGHFVDPHDPKRCLMGAPPALEAMDWIRARMWDDQVMATSLDVQNTGTSQAFVDKKIAMVEDGSWALKTILSSANFRIGVAPLPKGPARRVTLATTDGFGIFSGTRHRDEAWELMKFLISKDYGKAMAKANFLQPARASLVEDWIGYIRQEYPEKTKDLDLAVFAEGHLQGYSVTAEIFANMEEAKQLAYAAWEKIFTLGQAPADLMVEVAQNIQEAQKPTQ